jgi:hypothetical protein
MNFDHAVSFALSGRDVVCPVTVAARLSLSRLCPAADVFCPPRFYASSHGRISVAGLVGSTAPIAAG